MTKQLTLCIVHRNGRVLLGKKKRGFGQGRFNGFGGKLQEGETVEEGARREMLEESGLKALSLLKRGVLTFEFNDSPQILEVHIFKIANFSGKLVESGEMRPFWFSENKIPYDQMWPDDKYWYPLFLSDKNFYGRFHFRDHNTILNYELEEVPEGNL